MAFAPRANRAALGALRTRAFHAERLAPPAPPPALRFPRGWQGLVVHGGGEGAYKPTHPLVQLLSRHYCSEGVVSLELPAHGAHASPDLLSADEARHAFRAALLPHLCAFPTVAVGFSLGGKLLQSLWHELPPSHPHRGVFIGSPPTARGSRLLAISAFWTPLAFRLRGAAPALRRLHGDEAWEATVHGVRAWCGAGSPVHAADEALAALRRDEAAARVHWVRARHDLPYPRAAFAELPPRAVSAVGCGHFNFFREGWAETAAAVEACLERARPEADE
ncbi:hypothetical protein AB1Y20_005931 [Prymnesium parvum]|uniref:AB hydrolase-1 domain-containing protein n=1 Tax=Prymnesium parvum TaxID=97485 RepID=A0AB34J2M2_PRYPA